MCKREVKGECIKNGNGQIRESLANQELESL